MHPFLLRAFTGTGIVTQDLLSRSQQRAPLFSAAFKSQLLPQIY